MLQTVSNEKLKCGSSVRAPAPGDAGAAGTRWGQRPKILNSHFLCTPELLLWELGFGAEKGIEENHQWCHINCWGRKRLSP